MENTKKIFSAVGYGLLVFALLDLITLSIGLAQIGFEGRTGIWNPFWKVQAEFLIGLLK